MDTSAPVGSRLPRNCVGVWQAAVAGGSAHGSEPSSERQRSSEAARWRLAKMPK
jgi:hypothetical protein